MTAPTSPPGRRPDILRRVPWSLVLVNAAWAALAGVAASALSKRSRYTVTR